VSRALSNLEQRLIALEERVKLIAKALKLLLEEGEELPPEELNEVKKRLSDWTEGRRGEFIDLNEL